MLLTGTALFLGACAVPVGTPPAGNAALYRSAAESPLRTAEDHASDASRKPIAFLSFAKVVPAMHVLDVSAGAGNTTQLLALAVGERGRVYAQVPAPRPALDKRLADHPQANIVAVVRPFEDPVPPEAPMLDLVTINLSYHDIANLPIDRLKMDRRLFDALRPGGHLVVIDHAAAPGSGLAHTRTLHRIDEAQVRADFQQTGFQLEETSDYLRNPADAHDKKSSEMERMTDRFALRFVKPH